MMVALRPVLTPGHGRRARGGQGTLQVLLDERVRVNKTKQKSLQLSLSFPASFRTIERKCLAWPVEVGVLT